MITAKNFKSYSFPFRGGGGIRIFQQLYSSSPHSSKRPGSLPGGFDNAGNKHVPTHHILK